MRNVRRQRLSRPSEVEMLDEKNLPIIKSWARVVLNPAFGLAAVVEGVHVNREMIDMGLDDFVGDVCDQIESDESRFGESRREEHKLQNANVKTVGGVASARPLLAGRLHRLREIDANCETEQTRRRRERARSALTLTPTPLLSHEGELRSHLTTRN